MAYPFMLGLITIALSLRIGPMRSIALPTADIPLIGLKIETNVFCATEL